MDDIIEPDQYELLCRKMNDQVRKIEEEISNIILNTLDYDLNTDDILVPNPQASASALKVDFNSISQTSNHTSSHNNMLQTQHHFGDSLINHKNKKLGNSRLKRVMMERSYGRKDTSSTVMEGSENSSTVDRFMNKFKKLQSKVQTAYGPFNT